LRAYDFDHSANHRLAIDDRELEEGRIACETDPVREDYQTLGHLVESPESGLLLSVCEGRESGGFGGPEGEVVDTYKYYTIDALELAVLDTYM
jgi:hypothetical protein